MTQLRRRLGLVIPALALFVAGCGTGETTEAGSPLSEFLGQDVYGIDGLDENAQARFADEERLREEKVAACMKQQGFEYVPRETPQFDFLTTADGLAYDSREYAEKYGFGITTERFAQEEVGPDLIGHISDEPGESFEVDPNDAIVEAMDGATRAAYYEALYGGDDSFPSLDPAATSDDQLEALEDELGYEPQGCEGEVWAEQANNAFYQEFDSELQELYESVEDDPRLEERQTEITECVVDKGFQFGGLDRDGYQELYGRFEDGLNRIEEMVGEFPGEDLTDEELAAMTEEQLDELFDKPRELTPEAATLLGELQAEETELAVVVFDCGGSLSANEELYREVTAEYEERFLSDNADRLAPYEADR
ncbi:MAG: class I SAM-dependent methyltransferase [Acidimicrobiales bacterium]